MQSAVERILSGNFNTDNHVLAFSEPVIELSVKESESYEGSFTIDGPEDVFTEGWVSSTNPRVVCPVPNFSGNHISIPYSFDTRGLSSLDVFKGEFRIISNHGEYLLPYEVKIGADNLDTSIGNIKNLFHFTNLARTNWKEAVELFHSPDFERIFGGAEKQYLSVYRALKSTENQDQALEEFLLYIKKKQPADFIVEEPKVRVDSVLGELKKDMVINRNGWGYSDLSIECDAPFIVLSEDSITADDFDGNRVRISYVILEKYLHDGRNFGSIRLFNAYNDIYVNVIVENHPVNRKIADINRSVKHFELDMMRYYEAFRCKKITATAWMEETGKIVDELRALKPDDKAYELFHVQLLITMEKYNEARWTLEQMEEYFESVSDNALYCYYQYLFTLINRSEIKIDEVTNVVRSIYLEDQADWRVAWLLMYLSEDYARSPVMRWDLLRSEFRMGATSPVLYAEAYQILVNNPTVLSTLGNFEIQVLRYMAKKEILSPDVIEQFLYLFNRGKTYKKNMLKLLYSCYKVLPNDEVLQAVCLCLINLGRTDGEAFEWYAKAVDRQIRVTKLYEYYMESYDVTSGVEIPKMVLMYFSFDSALEPMKNAFLYAYIYRNKVSYPDLFESYREAIERFVTTNILAGNNNIYLAYLYNNMISRTMVNEDIAKGLSRALFTHLLTVKRNDISKVVLMYENVTNDYTFSLGGKKEIYIPLYGSNYRIVLEDKRGNRFTREEEFTIDRLMVPDILADVLAPLVGDLLFDLWICEHGKDIQPITAQNCEAMRRISNSELVDISIRREIKSKIVHFYYDNDRLEELDELISNIEVNDVKPGAASDIIHYMVLRGMYERAYEWVCFCGSENIDPKVIMRLCLRTLQAEDYSDREEEDKMMTSLVFYAFSRGKYDETLIRYLCKYFSGTGKELKELWKTACDYGIDTTELEVRILCQYLETNAFIPGILKIIQSFASKGRKAEIVIAILSQVCFEYFVNDRIIEDEYLDLLRKYIDDDAEIPIVCKLAYTKFYAGRLNEVSEKISRSVVMFLKDIISQGMYFAYFKEYANDLTYMHRYLDKTIVEYKVKEGARATIHYMVEKNGQSMDEYVKEEMRDMYHGICVKQFVLFFGERLEYYIVEHDGENEQLTLSDSYSHNGVEEHESDSKYNLINDIAISRTLGDYGTMDSLMLEYFRNEYLLGRMFAPEED